MLPDHSRNWPGWQLLHAAGSMSCSRLSAVDLLQAEAPRTKRSTVARLDRIRSLLCENSRREFKERRGQAAPRATCGAEAVPYAREGDLVPFTGADRRERSALRSCGRTHTVPSILSPPFLPTKRNQAPHAT